MEPSRDQILEALEQVIERLSRLEDLRRLERCLLAPAIEPGRQKAFFVCAGDCRNRSDSGGSPVRERSNVVLVPMPTDGGASYSFDGR